MERNTGCQGCSNPDYIPVCPSCLADAVNQFWYLLWINWYLLHDILCDCEAAG